MPYVKCQLLIKLECSSIENCTNIYTIPLKKFKKKIIKKKSSKYFFKTICYVGCIIHRIAERWNVLTQFVLVTCYQQFENTL